MQRPKSISVISFFHLILGVTFLLLAVPAGKVQETYILFGAVVSGKTKMMWFFAQGMTWLFFAYCFSQGIQLGLYLYLGLKAAAYLVTFLTAGVQMKFLIGLPLEALTLYFIWKNRDWFQNEF